MRDFEYRITWWVVQALSFVFTCDWVLYFEAGGCESRRPLKASNIHGGESPKGIESSSYQRAMHKGNTGRKIVTKNGNSVLNN
jgi:hypothetical protein